MIEASTRLEMTNAAIARSTGSSNPAMPSARTFGLDMP